MMSLFPLVINALRGESVLVSRRLRIVSALTVGLAVVSLSSSAQNAGQTVLPLDFFTQKLYHQFFLASEKPLADKPAEQLAVFTDIVRLAIAADKAAMEKDAVMQRIMATLQRSPDAFRYFTATQKVMAGDWKAMGGYFQGKAPDFDQWLRCIPVWKEHGYEVQSRLFSAVAVLGPMRNPEQMTQPLIDWLSFAGKERKFLDEFLQPYLNKDPPKLRELCNLLFQMYQQRRGPETSPFFELALQIGQDIGFASLERAMQFPYDRLADSLRMIRVYAEQHAEEASAQVRAAETCQQKGGYDEAKSIYEAALKTVPDPMTEDLRLAYCGFLKWRKQSGALRTEADRLLAASALLVDGKHTEAAAIFQTQLRNPRSGIKNRLAAWGGLLKCDPAAALNAGPDLIRELTVQPKSSSATSRSSFILPPASFLWLGNQLWQTVDLSTPRERFITSSTKYLRRITEADSDWPAKAANLMAQIVDKDPQSLPGMDGLRYPAACLFALAGQLDREQEILRRVVTYQQTPGKAGWLFPGILPGEVVPQPKTEGKAATPPQPSEAKKQPATGEQPNRYQMKTFQNPLPGQPEKLMQEVTQWLETWAKGPAVNGWPLQPRRLTLTKMETRTVPAPPSPITQTVASSADQVRPAALLVYQAALLLDPPLLRNRRRETTSDAEIDPKLFQPVAAALSEVLREDAVAKAGALIQREGILKAMMTVTNPQLLDSLFGLLTTTLDRCNEVWKDPKKLDIELKFLTGELDRRQGVDLKPYAQKLRERYLKP